MPRSPAQNDALRARTLERVLEAALAEFADHGYAAATVRGIAARAGVAVGLVYAHVDSKDALLVACFARSMHQVRETFREAASASPTSRLPTLVRAATRTVREHLPFWRLSYAVRTQPDVLAALGPALVAWEAEIAAALAATLRDAGSPAAELDARLLFAQIDGVCQHYAQQPEHYPLADVTDRLIARWTQPPPPHEVPPA